MDSMVCLGLQLPIPDCALAERFTLSLLLFFIVSPPVMYYRSPQVSFVFLSLELNELGF